jgi:hypothetical protein
LQIAVLFKPLPGFDDLKRICAGREHLAEQRVWVQGNRRDQTIELIGPQ